MVVVPRKLVVVGGGPHSSSVIDILLHSREFEVIGATNPTRGAGEILGVPIVGDDSCLPGLRAQGVPCAFVAVGDNRVRDRLARSAVDLGFELVNAIHPRATIAESVRLGRGIAVMAGAVINARSAIGDNSIINTCSSVDHDCTVGSAVHVAPGAHLGGNVVVASFVLVGMGAVVLHRLEIGEGASLGAGATVIRSVPPGATVVGTPARPLEDGRSR